MSSSWVLIVGAARLLCNEVLAIKRQPRSGCRYTCTARSPKGPLGSTRHLAHIAGHIGLMHIDKEMVHSYREREREKVGVQWPPTYICLGVNISSSIFTYSLTLYYLTI